MDCPASDVVLIDEGGDRASKLDNHCRGIDLMF